MAFKGNGGEIITLITGLKRGGGGYRKLSANEGGSPEYYHSLVSN